MEGKVGQVFPLQARNAHGCLPIFSLELRKAFVRRGEAARWHIPLAQ
jgi:hypothetical protein